MNSVHLAQIKELSAQLKETDRQIAALRRKRNDIEKLLTHAFHLGQLTGVDYVAERSEE